MVVRFIVYTLSEHQVGGDVVLRLKMTNDSVELQPDKMRPGDETCEHNGEVVLILDQLTSQLLGNKTIDLVTDEDGSYLMLN